MKLTLVLYFLSYLYMKISAKYMKKLEKTLWNEKCTKNSVLLNDCNWCRCNEKHQYDCKARVCHEVDMFGHFNDAIRDIKVGMEGHGVWRTWQTACESGVPYYRNELLCICTEDGNWPSAVCKDKFRFLHQVEITDKTRPSSKHKCAPTKMHLIGCNVCYCPYSGFIDPDMCTKNICKNDDDPILNKDEASKIDEAVEVYAECTQNEIYNLGCRECTCLNNNRLSCGKCDTKINVNEENHLCKDKELNKIFRKDCNLCYCTEKGLMHCSVKRCQNGNNKKLKRQLTVPNAHYPLVKRTISSYDCQNGTKFKKDCNTCYCFEHNGVKTVGCTMKACFDTITDLNANCIENTVFELNCQICHCYLENDVKIQVCKINEQCKSKKIPKEIRNDDLNILHGYCEPFRVYKDGCNNCNCQEDGKSVICTVNLCDQAKKPISVEIIPVKKNIGTCPKGYSYKIDCNVCFCLDNGNAICTTKSCVNSIK